MPYHKPKKDTLITMIIEDMAHLIHWLKYEKKYSIPKGRTEVKKILMK